MHPNVDEVLTVSLVQMVKLLEKMDYKIEKMNRYSEYLPKVLNPKGKRKAFFKMRIEHVHKHEHNSFIFVSVA